MNLNIFEMSYIVYGQVILISFKFMIKFKSVQRFNPQDAEGPRKFYARAMQNGITDLDELAELVALHTSMSNADCYAVLMGLETFVIREMQRGRNVQLGRLGTFRISINAEGVATEEEVISTTIKKAKLIFRPGTGLKNMLRNLKYEKAQK